MLENRSAMRRLLARLVLLGLVLRIAVPAGFMPSNLEDGWFLKLCPDGISMNVMMALMGHKHHHHHGDQEQSYQQCDLGGGLADDSSLPKSELFTSIALSDLTQAVSAPDLALVDQTRAFLARAPPHSRQQQKI